MKPETSIIIKLHLAIGEGDIPVIEFESKADLIEYLELLIDFDCVWLVADDKEKGEILITENLDTLISSVDNGLFNFEGNFYIQEYKTYESAYSVATTMRENNKKG